MMGILLGFKKRDLKIFIERESKDTVAFMEGFETP